MQNTRELEVFYASSFPSIRFVENKTSFGPVSAMELSLKKA